MDKLSLAGEWEIIERSLTDSTDSAESVLRADTCLTGRVPGDVNDSLVNSGRLPEPLTACQFKQFDWVKQRSWWYRKRFSLPAEWAQSSRVEITLDGLDVEADVWLNGVVLGHHHSAFRPMVCDVTGLVQYDDENVLLVRVTTGYERVVDHCDFPLLNAVPTEAVRGFPERGLKQRIFLRKPAYVWGWDWNPHLPTCGITGNVELHRYAKAEITNVELRTTLTDGRALITAAVELFYHTLTASTWADLKLTLTDERGLPHIACVRDVFIASGVNTMELRLSLSDPHFWWPSGSGEQHRYTVLVQAEINGKTVEVPVFKYGVRTVELVVKPERFFFMINGLPVFLKGGNWCPPDSLYGRISDKKVDWLVAEAAAANFNCLRVWGGGRYEIDAFYEACDRLGILVWQDFMSACAPLPASEEWFMNEFRKEAEYQMRRLQNRACIVLWCGNNEVSFAYQEFKQAYGEQKDPGWILYHEMLPRLVRDFNPGVPYWPTSPYGGRDNVTDAKTGDDHHWVVMSPNPEHWSNTFYWDGKNIPIFNSEYGYGGPCCIESTREYLGVDQPDLRDELGRQHTNSFYDIQRVNFSIEKHYGSSDNLPLKDYILLGGLCQGLNLGYSLESLRANEQTMGGIFWMYDDAWGENGWSIIDYYLRRKVSYYEVKRCLAPVRLVFRAGGQAFGGNSDEVLLIGLNEGAEPVLVCAAIGYQAYDGSLQELQAQEFTLAPHSRMVLAMCARPSPDRLATGTLVAIPAPESRLDPVVWKHCRYKEMGLLPAEVTVVKTERVGADLAMTVRSDQYAHAVHFDWPGDVRLNDSFFDLLPGEARRVIAYGQGDTTEPVRCCWVNRSAVSEN